MLRVIYKYSTRKISSRASSLGKKIEQFTHLTTTCHVSSKLEDTFATKIITTLHFSVMKKLNLHNREIENIIIERKTTDGSIISFFSIIYNFSSNNN